MSLETDGVWKGGLWASTIWADGVWREGAFVSSGLIGNKMLISYEQRKITINSKDRTMTPEYKERKMIV